MEGINPTLDEINEKIAEFDLDNSKAIEPSEFIELIASLIGAEGSGDEGEGTGDEGEGTGDEREGTGDEREGTGDEGEGTGDERERYGSGDEEEYEGSEGEDYDDRYFEDVDGFEEIDEEIAEEYCNARGGSDCDEVLLLASPDDEVIEIEPVKVTPNEIGNLFASKML